MFNICSIMYISDQNKNIKLHRLYLYLFETRYLLKPILQLRNIFYNYK